MGETYGGIFDRTYEGMVNDGTVRNVNDVLVAELATARRYFVERAGVNVWDGDQAASRARTFVLTACHAANKKMSGE